MAFKNELGVNISYDSSKLIEACLADIKKFGKDKKVFVLCRSTCGVTLYPKYSFKIVDMEPECYEYVDEMSLAKLLTLLEKQNEVI